MGWIASFGIALLTAVVAMFGAGTVAALAVDWYRISSFEGGSGFFVVGMAILGFIGGFVTGLVTSRVRARQAQAGFAKTLGIASGVVVGILAIVAGGSWMQADIPPLVDGEELFLVAEIRWPPATPVLTPAMLADSGETPSLRLGALSGHVARRMESGPLFVDDVRQEAGRWIVSGAVPIFTSRGARVLEVGLGGKSSVGFLVPLPGHPGEAERQWSEWLPRPPAGEAARTQPLPHAFTYRFKVIKRSEPVRTERIGPFEIDTVASYFYYVEGADRLAASATYRLRHHGQAIPGIAAADAIAVVAAGSAKPVLFVTIADPGDGLPCALVIDEGTTVRVQRVTGCAAPASTWLLTSDQAHFETARARKLLPGWIDRSSFAAPGLFVVRGAVIDTRDLTTAAFEWPMDARVDTDIPPLDLSPDERSFVWLAHESSEAGTRLGVTDWRANRSYFLPIDRTRMRYPTESALDPTWVRHHFEWRRGADGIDTLTERANVVPLAHRGDLTLTKPGDALFAVP